MKIPTIITAIDAVTATTTSDTYYVGNFSKIAILGRRAAHFSGSTAWSVTAGSSMSEQTDPTLVAYNMLISNVANSNAETNYTHVASFSSGAANGDFYTWMDIDKCPITHIAVTATETTDGTHSAFIIGWE